MSDPGRAPRDSRSAVPSQRIRVDLGVLPGWLQLLIGAALAVLIGALALIVSKPADHGSLLTGVVVGVVAIGVVAFAVARRR